MTRGLFIFLFSTLLLKSVSWSAYRLEGRVNLGDQWQPKIFMAAIEKLSDYYRASPDLIINIGLVDSTGYFILEGSNLPEEHRFYRLYLMKIQNDEYDACLYVGGDDHNFVHIIANNYSQLEINATKGYSSPFGNFEIKGDQDNKLMQNLARIVYPSFYFYQIKFPTELRFSEAKLHTDLKNFVDTCQSTIVSLAAVNNTDFDEYFDQDRLFYESFGDRLLLELPHSVYTSNYLRKLRYYANEDKATIPNRFWALVVLLGILLVIAVSWIATLHKKLTELESKFPSDAPIQSPELAIQEMLTQKESEILQLIGQGKSNKEIASELYVELSTVKTHINKIYTKLNVKNRREAAQIAIRM